MYIKLFFNNYSIYTIIHYYHIEIQMVDQESYIFFINKNISIFYLIKIFKNIIIIHRIQKPQNLSNFF